MTKLLLALDLIVLGVVVVVKSYERQVESDYMAKMVEAQKRIDRMKVDNYTNGLKTKAEEDKKRKGSKRGKKGKRK